MYYNINRSFIYVVYIKRFISKTYEEIKKDYQGLEIVENVEYVKYQAEVGAVKSSSSLYATSDNTSPLTENYNGEKNHLYQIRLNLAGGNNWKSAGDFIEWTVNVPKEGLYNLSLRYLQDLKSDLSSYRTLYINGEVPFKECESIEFEYTKKFVVKTFGDDSGAWYFHLKEGKNTIRLQVSLGKYAEAINEIKDIINRLNALYRRIIVVTGTAPDINVDYQLERVIPGIVETFKKEKDNLVAINKIITDTEGKKTVETVALGKLIDQLDEFANNVDDDKVTAVAGSVHSIDELTDYNFVMKHFYVVANATTLTEDILKLDEIVEMDLTIEKKGDKPQILIFHTHSQEGFSDTESNGKSIVDVGRYLTQILTDEYGYNVLHITEEFDMRNGKLDRGLAYTYANERVAEILQQYPEIEVVIDVHRDVIDESSHLVTEIDGRQTAKIMLFNGISYTDEQGELEHIVNPYRTENLAMTYHMYLLGEKMYPDFIRCIYIEGYRYCLHHRARSLLIEAGAQTNSYEEVCNAMIPLARILATELGEK